MFDEILRWVGVYSDPGKPENDAKRGLTAALGLMVMAGILIERSDGVLPAIVLGSAALARAVWTVVMIAGNPST